VKHDQQHDEIACHDLYTLYTRAHTHAPIALVEEWITLYDPLWHVGSCSGVGASSKNCYTLTLPLSFTFTNTHVHAHAHKAAVNHPKIVHTNSDFSLYKWMMITCTIKSGWTSISVGGM